MGNFCILGTLNAIKREGIRHVEGDVLVHVDDLLPQAVLATGQQEASPVVAVCGVVRRGACSSDLRQGAGEDLDCEGLTPSSCFA